MLSLMLDDTHLTFASCTRLLEALYSFPSQPRADYILIVEYLSSLDYGLLHFVYSSMDQGITATS